MAALYDNVASVVPKATYGAEDVVTINFVEDGLAAFGKVWRRGEELSVKRDTPEWEATCDRDGNSWMDLTDQQQFSRWGEVRFREGLWAGRPLTAIDDPALSDEDRAALEQAERERNAALEASTVSDSDAPKPAAKKTAAKKTAAKKAAPKVDEESAEETSTQADDFLEDLNKDD